MYQPTYPTIRAYMSFSFIPFLPPSPRKTSGPRPSLSITPGRNGSITISADDISFLSMSRPTGIFESIAMDLLPRLRMSTEIEEGLSTRTTEAPLSARTRPANGPGASPANCVYEGHVTYILRRLAHYSLLPLSGPEETCLFVGKVTWRKLCLSPRYL